MKRATSPVGPEAPRQPTSDLVAEAHRVFGDDIDHVVTTSHNIQVVDRSTIEACPACGRWHVFDHICRELRQALVALATQLPDGQHARTWARAYLGWTVDTTEHDLPRGDRVGVPRLCPACLHMHPVATTCLMCPRCEGETVSTDEAPADNRDAEPAGEP